MKFYILIKEMQEPKWLQSRAASGLLGLAT